MNCFSFYCKENGIDIEKIIKYSYKGDDKSNYTDNNNHNKNEIDDIQYDAFNDF